MTTYSTSQGLKEKRSGEKGHASLDTIGKERGKMDA